MTNIKDICLAAKEAANSFMKISTEQKNAILAGIKEEIMSNVDKIYEYNRLDLIQAKENGRNDAFIDRLTLTDSRIRSMATEDAIIKLTDPVGKSNKNTPCQTA